jgi:hypothetical protein
MSTNESGFTSRSKGKAILYTVVSLGLYSVYWMHRFHVEAKAESGADYNPLLRTVGLFVPLYNFYVFWQDSKLIESEFGTSAPVSFLLYFFLPPVWWWLTQTNINERAAAA